MVPTNDIGQQAGRIHYLVESDDSLDLNQALARPAPQWLSMTTHGSLGYTERTHWFRKRLALPPSAEHNWRLTIANTVLDHVDLWVRFRSSSHQVSDWQHWHVGDKQVFESRPIPVPQFAIPLTDMNAGFQAAEIEIAARVRTSSSMQFPVSVTDEETFEIDERTANLGYGVYMGLMGGMFFYNLILWLSVRERIYGWYVTWVLHFAIFVLSLDGLTFQHLWPHALWWNDHGLIWLLGVAVICGSGFIQEFLKDAACLPAWTKRPVRDAAVLLPVVLVSTFCPYSIGIRIVIALAVALIVRLEWMIVLAWWRKHRSANILFVAFTGVFIGGCVLALQRVGLMENSRFTQHTTLIGSAVEVTLLSLALAQRLSHAREVAHAARKMTEINRALSIANRDIDLARHLAEERAQALLLLQDKVSSDAEKRDQERLQFLASAVHDLKQPLQAIGVALKPLGTAIVAQQPQQAMQMLDLAQRAAQVMRDQLASLLDLSRLESGAVKATMAPLHLAPFLADIALTLQEFAHRQGVTLQLQVPNTACVHSDELLLRRIVLNLATNGIKYSDPGKGAARQLTLTVTEQGRAWQLCVSDNGIGIQPEHIDSGDIYRPFFQVHNQLPEDVKGVGLGLSIVNSAVRLLANHQMILTSELGVGTQFTLSIGACAPQASAVPTRRLSTQPEERGLRGAYLVVIEDDRLVRESLVLFLTALGIVTEAVGSLEELQLLLPTIERDPSAVICDFRLPNGYTGHDALAAVHERFGPLPCLVVSAEKLAREDFQFMDPIEICTKPLHPDALVQALHRVIPGTDAPLV